MTIRTKLTLNVVLTLATVGVVAATSIVGIRYIKGKLGDLTERSAPFQVRTLDLQRAVQRVLGDLVATAGVRDAEEYRRTRAGAEKALAEVRVAQEALDALGGGGHADAVKLLGEASRELFVATDGRLSSEAAAGETTKVVGQKISATLAGLGSLSEAARTIHEAKQRDYLAAYAAGEELSSGVQTLLRLSASVKDLQFASFEMHVARDKVAFLKARGRVNLVLKKLQQVDVALLRSLPVGLGVLSDKLDQYGKAWTPPGADGADRGALNAAHAELSQALAGDASRLDSDSLVIFEKSRVEIDRVERLVREVSQAAEAQLAAARSVAVFQAIDGVSSRLPLCETKADLDAVGERLRTLFAQERKAIASVTQASARLGKGAGLGSGGAVTQAVKEIEGLVLGPGGSMEKMSQRVEMKANASAATEKLRSIVAVQRADGDRAVSGASAQQEQSIAAVHRVVRGGTTLITAAALASVLLGLGFGVWVYRSISQPLKNLIEVSAQVAGGDLTGSIRAHARDEVGRVQSSMAEMVTNLRGIVTRIGEATGSLAGSSEELSATALDLERGSTEQTAQIQQSAAAVHQIAQTTVEVARNSTSASQTAGEMRQVAEQGREAMQLTVGELKKFAEQVEEAVSTVEGLGSQSEQIGGIVQVIDGIADQTNLLALNAAIEAARAGEQGRGFAVVADEVRKLAERTGTATGEIGQVVKTMQASVGQAVTFIKDERESAERILERVNRTLEAIEEIARQVTSVTGAVQQTAVAVEEQSVTTDEVSRNMENAAAVTVQLQHSVGGIRGSSDELSRLASDLNSLVEWFKV